MGFLAGFRAGNLRWVLLLLLACVPSRGQFLLLNSGTTASLRGIDAVSEHVAWASGSGGTVLLTTDGGATWKHCAVPAGGEKLDFRGVQGVDAKTAVVMASGPGAQSAVFRTTDGCASWALVLANPDKEGFFDTLRLWHADQAAGYLLGDPVDGRFVVYATVDRGQHWVRLASDGLMADKGMGAFAASNTSLVMHSRTGGFEFATGGPDGPFLYRLAGPTIFHADGTRTESVKRIRLPMAGSTNAAGVFSLLWTVAVGGDYTHPDAREGTAAYLQATDQWLPAQTMPGGYRSAVAQMPSSSKLLAVGPNGTDISTDNGRNWSPLRPAGDDAPDADKGWNAISLPFVVGSKGRIGRMRE